MKVKFLPQNVEFEIQPGQTVMNLAHEKGIPIHTTCNGMPSCAECRVRVVEGEHNLLPPSKKEQSLIGTGYYIDQRRLSCQLVCFGDVVIDTQEHLDRLSSGPVTKKFLSRVQKDSAEQSYSVGDVLIEKDEELLKEIGHGGNVDDGESSHDGELFNQMLQSQDRKQKQGGGGGQQRHQNQGQRRHNNQGNQGQRHQNQNNQGQRQQARPQQGGGNGNQNGGGNNQGGNSGGNQNANQGGNREGGGGGRRRNRGRRR